MEPIDVILDQNSNEPCFICETRTHAFVPKYDSWLCFQCFCALTAIVLTAESAIASVPDIIAAVQRHENN